MQNAKNDQELITAIRYAFSFKENIDTFSKFFFPEFITNKIPDFHKEIYELLFKSSNDAFAAPRGHAKSTTTGLIFILFCVVNKLEQYIVYISQNHAKTVQFIEPIRNEIKNNKWLKIIYPELILSNSKDESGRDREDCFDINGVRIEAVSFEKNLRGFKYLNMRPTLIIGDDIEEDTRTLNPELRVKDENKLNKVIIPSLDINGRFKYIGTILHYDSLLMKKIKQYRGQIYAACDENFENLLWPDRFNKQKLLDIKTDIGTIAFQQEFLNNPADNENSIIKKEWIMQCLREDLSFEDLQKEKEYSLKVMGADFAFSDRVTSDKSAYCSLGVKDDFYYLFHTETFKGWSVSEQLNHIKNVLHTKHYYDQIGLEENSIKAVSKDLRQYNLPITLFWTGAQDKAQSSPTTKDYEYLGKRHTVGKINLIMRLATAFENKRFILPYKTEADKQIVDQLIAECTSFALNEGKLVEAGVHPDIPIGLGYALELANNINSVVVLT